jgi:hypothetical protein
MEIPLLGAPCCVFAFFALVAVLVVLAVLGERKDKEAFRRQADQWGFRHYPDDPWDLPSRYAGQIEFFKQGSSRTASNILAGTMDGASILAFQYSFKTGSGKDESTWYYGVAVLQLPIRAPHLQLRDEGLLDKVAAWVGHDDINFESAEFSRRYHVKCDEPKFAYDLFHARLIEYLLACGHCPGMEMRGTLLVLYDDKGTDVEHVVRLVEVGRAMISSIPEYVLHERGAGPPGPAPA